MSVIAASCSAKRPMAHSQKPRKTPAGVGGGRARKSPVHVDDLLSRLLAMAGNPVTFGKTYNLSGGETVTLRELAQLMLAKQGLAKPMLTIPAGLCRIAARIWGTLNRRPMLMEHTMAGLTQDADLDHSAATQEHTCPTSQS
jgi:nucleoside-diphosphate-sugar epimerase